MVGTYVLDGGGSAFCTPLSSTVGIYIYALVLELNSSFCLTLTSSFGTVDVCVTKAVGINKYERYFYAEWHSLGLAWGL